MPAYWFCILIRQCVSESAIRSGRECSYALLVCVCVSMWENIPVKRPEFRGRRTLCACVTPRSPGRLRAADCSLDSPGVDSCATSRTYHHHLTTEISIMVPSPLLLCDTAAAAVGSSFDSFFYERCSW